MKDRPIHINSINNQIEELQQSLEQGSNVDCIGEHNCTPLHYACREQNLKIAELLIKNGANVNKKNGYSTIYPIFDSLSSLNKKDSLFLIRLLIKNGADINAVDSFGNTPLHYAVEQENLYLIELFIKLGCNINKTLRYDKDTALHYACFQKNGDIILKLIQHGADTETLNIYNKTPQSYL